MSRKNLHIITAVQRSCSSCAWSQKRNLSFKSHKSKIPSDAQILNLQCFWSFFASQHNLELYIRKTSLKIIAMKENLVRWNYATLCDPPLPTHADTGSRVSFSGCSVVWGYQKLSGATWFQPLVGWMTVGRPTNGQILRNKISFGTKIESQGYCLITFVNIIHFQVAYLGYRAQILKWQSVGGCTESIVEATSVHRTGNNS